MKIDAKVGITAYNKVVDMLEKEKYNDEQIAQACDITVVFVKGIRGVLGIRKGKVINLTDWRVVSQEKNGKSKVAFPFHPIDKSAKRFRISSFDTKIKKFVGEWE